MSTVKIKITLFKTSSSGSNNDHLYRAATDELKNKYDIELLTMEQARLNRHIDLSDVYITTHGEYISPYDKVNIDLWHGFPLKGMAKMDKQETIADEDIYLHWSKVDMIMSYSTLYNTAMNACNGANIKKYRITGLPRNDALYAPTSREYLNRLLPTLDSDTETVLFFMPTFRKSMITPDKLDGKKNVDNIFGFASFNKEVFVDWLQANKISLVIKLHPFEEHYFAKEVEELKSSRIHVINDSLLARAELDLYDILGAADMLITDYSSVYIDYLLLNRPIVFLPTDLEDYQATRGLLFEPYEFWTPGPKAHSQSDLQQTIEKYCSNPTWFHHERKTILSLCHQYTDGQAAQRIWSMIDDYIEAHLDVIYERRRNQENHIQLQQQVKNKINNMIEQGQIAQANQAIQQYLESNRADSDIFSMNGMLHLHTGNAQEAIQSFLRGHQHFPWDEDLLYNLGYVYEMINDIPNAVSYYQQASQLTTKSELLALIEGKLNALSLSK